jgi:hypothetical protein
LIVPIRDPARPTFVDPATGSPLLAFDDVQDLLDDVDDLEPAHLVRIEFLGPYLAALSAS